MGVHFLCLFFMFAMYSMEQSASEVYLAHRAAAPLLLVVGRYVLFSELVHDLPIVVQPHMLRLHLQTRHAVLPLRSAVLAELVVHKPPSIDSVGDALPVLVALAVCDQLHEQLLGLPLPHSPRVPTEFDQVVLSVYISRDLL
ncbi:hypothetical protein B484DRAFT_443269 [Ochromonadaceae sp. CCMP2298]|nr:hypothetical protein B484DRAFT_443269 [Ochromonadaceae sp. CCMP2298]